MNNLKGRIEKIHFTPALGDRLDEFKEHVKAFCLEFNCTATFDHNSKEFICDKEGNIAQTN